MVDHPTEYVNLPSQTALDNFASELGGPMQNMARSGQGGGHNADHITQSALSILWKIAIRSIRPTDQSQRGAMTPSWRYDGLWYPDPRGKEEKTMRRISKSREAANLSQFL